MDISSFNATHRRCPSFPEAIIVTRKCSKPCLKSGVLRDFAVTVSAMVALPKKDSLYGLATRYSQAPETKIRMMWRNCLTIPTITTHIVHNFGYCSSFGPATESPKSEKLEIFEICPERRGRIFWIRLVLHRDRALN